MSGWLANLRDVLAMLGVATVVGLLGYALGSAHAQGAIAAQLAGADSAALARARADSGRAAAATRALDSALAGWAAARAAPGAVIHDTVQVPSDTSTVILGMAQYSAGSDPASLQRVIDSLQTIIARLSARGDTVAQACRVVAQDCAAVRRDRDTLAVQLARADSLLRLPAPRPSRWRFGVGVGCVVAVYGGSGCGPLVAGVYTWP